MADKKKDTVVNIEYSRESAQDLLGRQSVRTTFKLTERSIDALSILASQLGIKQKSLFDHLIDDDTALRVIARESETYQAPSQRVAKTYVISRRTLQNLERISSRYQAPRDALVELSIERILPLISEEKEKHEKRKNLLQEVGRFAADGEKLFTMAGESLDQDDPVYQRIYQMIKTVRGGYEEIEACVERGRKIEDF